jgi:IS30 family transposase
VVTAKLDLRWSPQQISRFLRRAHPADPAMRACAETIYRALYAGALGERASMLRTRRRCRKKHRRGVPPVNKIKNMRLVHHRPVEVNDRRQVGHWEGDLIIGRGQASNQLLAPSSNEPAATSCSFTCRTATRRPSCATR